MTKKVVGLTSAREHSQRLHDKELNKLGEKYLIEYTLDQLAKLDIFDVRLMSTDWTRLIELMEQKYPTIQFIQRPKELALNDTPAQAYITHALQKYPPEEYIYCLLQSTSPLRMSHLIIKSFHDFKRFESKYDINSLFTVNRFTLKPDGQIYWFKDPNDIWKAPSSIILCNPSVDVDYISDVRIAESIFHYRFSGV